jgi:hypothetical protein
VSERGDISIGLLNKTRETKVNASRNRKWPS